MNKRPSDIFIEAGLTAAEAAAYEALLSGTIRAKDIVRRSKLPRPTVYYALEKLMARGLVSRSGKEGSSYRCEPFERFSTYLESRAAEARALVEDAGRIRQIFEPKGNTHAPHVSFIDSVEGMKRILMDMVYAKKPMIESFVSEPNFFWEMGEDFVRQYVEERVRRGIKTRNLWLKRIEQSVFDRYYRELSEVRILPKGMLGSFATSFFLFDNKVLYVAPKREGYALQVASSEHVRLTRALFEQVWVASKPH